MTPENWWGENTRTRDWTFENGQPLWSRESDYINKLTKFCMELEAELRTALRERDKMQELYNRALLDISGCRLDQRDEDVRLLRTPAAMSQFNWHIGKVADWLAEQPLK